VGAYGRPVRSYMTHVTGTHLYDTPATQLYEVSQLYEVWQLYHTCHIHDPLIFMGEASKQVPNEAGKRSNSETIAKWNDRQVASLRGLRQPSLYIPPPSALSLYIPLPSAYAIA